MTTPCIITVAITGSLPQKSDNPAVPISIAEQIELTHEAFEAGATSRSCACTQGRWFADFRPRALWTSCRGTEKALSGHHHPAFDWRPFWIGPRTRWHDPAQTGYVLAFNWLLQFPDACLRE